MSILQYFSKNFFSKIFPDKYFQAKDAEPPEPDKLKKPVQSGGYSIEDTAVNIYIKPVELYIDFNYKVNIDIKINDHIQESEEELIRIIEILFDIENSNNKKIINEEDEKIAIIIENLL